MQTRFTERKIITITPTIDAGAYSAFDDIGGKFTVSDSIPIHIESAAIVSARIFDKASQAHPYELFIFDQDPSASTITNNAAITMADADLTKIAGVIQFATATRFAFADNSFTAVDGLYIPVKPSAGTTTFYAALRTGSGGTPTYVSTSDITIELFLDY